MEANVGRAVANEEAVAHILGKNPVSRAAFDALAPELRARSFAVTGVENLDALQRIRDRLAALPAGGDWKEIRRDVAAELRPWLVDPDASPEDQARQAAAAERRAELLLRTHGFEAYRAAQWGTIMRQREIFPWLRFQTQEDDHVRDGHSALNGLIIPVTSSFWTSPRCPFNDWGCRCGAVGLMEMDVDEARAADAGKPEAERRVIEGARLKLLEEQGRLDLGNGLQVSVWAAEGSRTGHPWGGEVTAEMLRGGYDDAELDTLAEWSGKQKLPPEQGANLLEKLGDLRFDRTVARHSRIEPLSDAVDVLASGPAARKWRRALSAVNRAHDDGGAPKLVADAVTMPPNILGEYRRGIGGARSRAAVDPDGPWPAFTAVHEVGHHVELALDMVARPARMSPVFEAWRAAVDASTTVAQLRWWKARVEDLSDDSYEELWARSYAQFVAIRSRDRVLLRGLAQASQLLFRQWPAEDFAKIEAAIVEILRVAAWIR